MTPPDSAISKNPAAHAARMQLGNFFLPKGNPSTSFESLLPRDPRTPQKRKPAEDHPAFAPTTPQTDPTPTKKSIDSPQQTSSRAKQSPDTPKQTSDAPKQPSDTAQQQSATAKQGPVSVKPSPDAQQQTADTASQDPTSPKSASETPKQTSDTPKQQTLPAEQPKDAARPAKELPATKADSPPQQQASKAVDGTETAENPDDMVSLATIDDVESGVRQTNTANPRDAAFITTAARLPANSASQRQTLGGITGASSTGDTADAALHQAATAPRALAAKSPASAAASLLKALPAELDKFRQSGKSSLQLDLPVGDNESVKIRLNLRGNEIRATFIADSPELREALAKAWPEFSSASRERGFRFGDPSFQDSSNQKENRNEQTEEPSFAPPTRPAPRQPTRQSDPNALWA
jgi:hypothetical protein